MADTFLYRNNAVSTLLSPINNTDVTIFLQTGEGVLFPSPAAGQRFAATLTDAAGNIEIVYCTAQPVADQLTVIRGQEGTTALSWLAGDSITMRLTMGIMLQLLQADGNVLIDSNADMVDGINANAVPTANELLPLDGSAQLPATAYNSLLLEGQTLAYVLARANHTGVIPYTGLPSSLTRTYVWADGTFTTPDNITYLNIILRSGGGGGGGGGDGNSSNGGWGGSGGISTSRNFLITAIPGEVFTLTMGAGGAGGTAPNAAPGNAGSDGGYTQATGNIVDADSLNPGQTYLIETLGTTDFTLMGASANIVGTYFTMNNYAGPYGTGTAKRCWRSDVGTGGAGGAYASYDGSLGGVLSNGGPGGNGMSGSNLDKADSNYTIAFGGALSTGGNGNDGENAKTIGGGGGGGSGADTNTTSYRGGYGGDGLGGYAYFEY